MSDSTYTLEVGDRIVVDTRRGGDPLTMVVHDISRPGTYGIAMSAGPVIHAWIGPGRYGVTFDATSTWLEWHRAGE